MQKYVLSELDSGERVISERVSSRCAPWRSASGSAPARGTSATTRAGVSHFIEHMLFKGSRSYDAQQIAETFDAMGAELNAATSHELAVVYAPRPRPSRRRGAGGLMTDMVFAPAFADLVSRSARSSSKEIAMYERTPRRELVHDLFSEAVFGKHALGHEARDRDSRRDLVRSAAGRWLHTARCTGGNIVVAAAGSIAHDRFISLLGPLSTRAPPPARTAPRVRR